MTHHEALNAALLALAEAFKANMTRGRGVPADFEEQACHFPRFVLDRIRGNQADQLGVGDETVTLPAPVLIQLVADALRAPELSDHLRQSESETNGWVTGWKNYRKPIRERQRSKAMLGRKRTHAGDAVTPAMVQAFAAEWHTRNPGRQKGLIKATCRQFGLTSKTANIYLNKTE